MTQPVVVQTTILDERTDRVAQIVARQMEPATGYERVALGIYNHAASAPQLEDTFEADLRALDAELTRSRLTKLELVIADMEANEKSKRYPWALDQRAAARARPHSNPFRLKCRNAGR